MKIRSASIEDKEKIKSLYLDVSETEGGIARFQDEITDEYIGGFISSSNESGIILVAEGQNHEVIGEIHAYKSGLRVFDHVLTNLTITISPLHQGKGIGKILFTRFLEIVEKSQEISRVELIARESNKKAIDLYKKLGFKVEGILKNKIKNSDGRMEGDIIMGWLKK